MAKREKKIKHKGKLNVHPDNGNIAGACLCGWVGTYFTSSKDDVSDIDYLVKAIENAKTEVADHLQ